MFLLLLLICFGRLLPSFVTNALLLVGLFYAFSTLSDSDKQLLWQTLQDFNLKLVAPMETRLRDVIWTLWHQMQNRTAVAEPLHQSH